MINIEVCDLSRCPEPINKYIDIYGYGVYKIKINTELIESIQAKTFRMSIDGDVYSKSMVTLYELTMSSGKTWITEEEFIYDRN